jgi:CIC family chloride channel protein
MNRHNFYDALLEQDGHRLEHVRPPRDLHGWQQLPVSAIANFQAVVVEDLSPAALEKILKTHPYQRFPVLRNGRLEGILTRSEAEAVVKGKPLPNLEVATTCWRDQTIHNLQKLLIEAAAQCVVVLDREGGTVVGLVTLHDLLRAQAAMAQQTQEDG